jgi:hypothetical protein
MFFKNYALRFHLGVSRLFGHTVCNFLSASSVLNTEYDFNLFDLASFIMLDISFCHTFFTFFSADFSLNVNPLVPLWPPPGYLAEQFPQDHY